MSYWEGRWRQYCPIGGRVFCFWAKYLRFWGFEQELWLLKVGRLWNFEFVTKIKRHCKNYTRSILFWVLGSETNISWRQPYWLLVLFVSGIKANNDSLNYLNHYGGQTLWHNCATNLHFWISIPYQPGMVPVTKDQWQHLQIVHSPRSRRTSPSSSRTSSHLPRTLLAAQRVSAKNVQIVKLFCQGKKLLCWGS